MIKDTNKHFYHLEQYVSGVHYTPVCFPEFVLVCKPDGLKVHDSSPHETFALPQWNWNHRQTTELYRVCVFPSVWLVLLLFSVITIEWITREQILWKDFMNESAWYWWGGLNKEDQEWIREVLRSTINCQSMKFRDQKLQGDSSVQRRAYGNSSWMCKVFD